MLVIVICESSESSHIFVHWSSSSPSMSRVRNSFPHHWTGWSCTSVPNFTLCCRFIVLSTRCPRQSNPNHNLADWDNFFFSPRPTKCRKIPDGTQSARNSLRKTVSLPLPVSIGCSFRELNAPGNMWVANEVRPLSRITAFIASSTRSEPVTCVRLLNLSEITPSENMWSDLNSS